MRFISQSQRFLQYRLRGSLGLIITVAYLCVHGVAALAEDNLMMTPSRASAEVAGLFAPVLEEKGFIRSGLSFYRYTDESILLINIQPGTLWLGPYINLGVYYFKFGEMDRPGIVDCHVQTRLISVVPNPLREEELLQMTNDIPMETRRAELVEMMHNSGLPWLEGMAVFDSARTFLPGSTKAAHIAPIARGELTSSEDKK